MKIMALEEHFTGILKIELTGNQLQRFLNICYHRGIDMNDLVFGPKTVCFYMAANHLNLLQELGLRYHTKVTVKTKRGLPFLLQNALYRRGFLLGMVICYAFLIYMSGCIWEIKFDGNRYHTDDSMKTYLTDVGIRYGYRMNHIDAEELELMIRKQYEDVAWCSVQKDGCRLTITITESQLNLENQNETLSPNEGIAIVADRDAVISHLVTQEGEAMVKIGQSVKEGEVLINGYITYTDDFNYVTGYKGVFAKADIKAIWEIPFEMSVSLTQNTSETCLTEYKEFPLYDVISKISTDGQKEYFIQLNLGNQDLVMPYTYMSDGMLNQSMLLSVLLSMPENSVLLIDEIEDALHPLTILDFIKVAQSKNIQLIFSSHNTYLLQKLRPDQIIFANWKNANKTLTFAC